MLYLTIYSLPIVGVSFNKRQNLLSHLENGEPLFFKPEPHNSYDPKALAVVTSEGQHVGYIGRNNPIRDKLLSAIDEKAGMLVARLADKRGGYNGRNYGASVEFYCVPTDWLMRGFEDKDEDEEPVEFSRSNTKQKRKEYTRKYKDRDLTKMALNNPSANVAAGDKQASRKVRHEFKAGEDMKVIWKRNVSSRHYGKFYIPENFGRKIIEERRSA